MKAMIFAAGLGTRLRPFTDHQPKALFPIQKRTLLELCITKLKKHGCDEIVINVHHFSDLVRDYLKANNNFGCTIHLSNEDEELLNTGGGLKKASCFLRGNEPFLLINVDILTDLDLDLLLDFHKKNNALVSLAVQDRETSRYLLFDASNQLGGWEDVRKEKKICVRTSARTRLAFSGIHVVDPRIFDLITEDGSFSIIDLYLRLAASERIFGFDHSLSNWFDVGKIDHVYEAELRFELMSATYND